MSVLLIMTSSPVMARTTFLLTTCLTAVFIRAFAAAEDPKPPSPHATRETTVQVLRPLAGLVGDWKGVGQPKRGSNVGAWSETANAAWKFEGDSAGLILTFDPGKQFHSATFSVAKDGETAQLLLAPLEGEPLILNRTNPAGHAKPSDAKAKDDVKNNDAKSGDDTWIFESASSEQRQTRCTIRIISDIRITLLFEEKPTPAGSLRRMAEIGLTRAGSKLASGNTGERQCVVTGGLGTIKVSHVGKIYYVCCEGCKQAFDADPEGTLKAYRERLNQAQ